MAVAVAVVTWGIADPTRFSQASLESTFRGWGSWAFGGYAVASLVRGAFLIPSTPVVLAGAALFPDRALLVLLVSIAGVLASAALLYRFPGYAGYDRMLAAKYPEHLARLQHHLARPRAIWFVAAWAFFPVTPTDLICYAAGLVGMPYRRLIIGIMIGKVPLVTAYIFIGQRAAELLLP